MPTNREIPRRRAPMPEPTTYAGVERPDPPTTRVIIDQSLILESIREAEEVHQGHVDTLGGTWQHCIASSCSAVRKVLAPLVPEIRSRNDGQSNDVESRAD